MREAGIPQRAPGALDVKAITAQALLLGDILRAADPQKATTPFERDELMVDLVRPLQDVQPRAAEAAALAAEGTEAPGDLNASPEFREHLARVLVRRALDETASR